MSGWSVPPQPQYEDPRVLQSVEALQRERRRLKLAMRAAVRKGDQQTVRYLERRQTRLSNAATAAGLRTEEW